MTQTESFLTNPRSLSIGGKMISFVSVDPNCPTVREAWGWETIGPIRFRTLISTLPAQKVLITNTNPVKAVFVIRTFPRLNMVFRHISRDDFYNFLTTALRPPPSLKVNWMKEGF